MENAGAEKRPATELTWMIRPFFAARIAGSRASSAAACSASLPLMPHMVA